MVTTRAAGLAKPNGEAPGDSNPGPQGVHQGGVREERSNDSVVSNASERKRPLLRVDTGAVADHPLPFATTMASQVSPASHARATHVGADSTLLTFLARQTKSPPWEKKCKLASPTSLSPGREAATNGSLVRVEAAPLRKSEEEPLKSVKAKKRGSRKPVLPAEYMEMQIGHSRVQVAKPMNRLVLYGSISVDPARKAQNRRGSLSARGPAAQDDSAPRMLQSDAPPLANNGVHTHRPSTNNPQLPAVRDIGSRQGESAGAGGTREFERAQESGAGGRRDDGGGGKDGRKTLPDMKIQWRAPPKDSLRSPMASKQVLDPHHPHPTPSLDPSLPMKISCFRWHAVLCGWALTFCAPDQVYVAKPNARKTLVRGKPLGRYYEMLVTQEQELSGAAKRKGHEANGGEKIDLENFDKDGQERRRINSPTSVGLFCFCDGLSLFLSLCLASVFSPPLRCAGAIILAYPLLARWAVN